MEKEEHIKKSNKSFPLIIAVVVFILALILGIFLFSSFKSTKIITTTTPTPFPDQETPTMMLSFLPNTLTVSQDNKINASLLLDTLGNPVESVKIVVSFDPNQIENPYLSPSKDSNSLLSSVLNQVPGKSLQDAKNGTLSQEYVIPKNTAAPKGKGIIAVFSGYLKPGVSESIVKISTTSSATSSKISRVVLGKVNLEIHR